VLSGRHRSMVAEVVCDAGTRERGARTAVRRAVE
jgi:hypothetical protein